MTNTYDDPVTKEVARILSQALRDLGDAGRPNDASRLAAQAWLVLRDVDEGRARRLNGLMHYLAGLPDQPDDPDWGVSAPTE